MLWDQRVFQLQLQVKIIFCNRKSHEKSLKSVNVASVWQKNNQFAILKKIMMAGIRTIRCFRSTCFFLSHWTHLPQTHLFFPLRFMACVHGPEERLGTSNVGCGGGEGKIVWISGGGGGEVLL